jgi:heme exporter protein CcmD
MLTKLNTFLQMGGYAVYVWSAYACAVLIFGWNFYVTRKQAISMRRKLSAEYQQQKDL